MKKSELAFTVALVPLDFSLVLLAALTAYSLRFGWLSGIRPITFNLPYSEYWPLALLTAGVFVVCFALAGLYAVTGPRRLKLEIARVFFAGSTAILALVLTIFFQREQFASRFIILAVWLLALAYVSFGRIALRIVQRQLLKHGVGAKRVLLIGAPEEPAFRSLKDEFAAHPGIGYRVVMTAAKLDETAKLSAEKLIAAGELDELLVADTNFSRDDITRMLGFANSRQLGFRYAADPLATHAKNIELGMFAGVPIVEIRGTRLDGWGRVFKRCFDVVGALMLIVLTSPIMLVAAVAIVVDSGLPIFFRRLDDGTPVTRVGERGRPFTYLKFRSMRPKSHDLRYTALAHLDTRQEGPLVKIKDDPRVTRVGKFLRRYSIDELPEFFLVLAGRMSLVGPRPHLPEEVAKYQDHHRRVLTVKPGITGLAQVSGRADLTFEDEVRLDTYYVENWSPWLDLTILVKTPLVVLSRRGAY